MAKIKFDVSSEEFGSAKELAAQPKPGVYRAKVHEINSGYSKKKDGSGVDKNRPRLEVIYEITEKGAMSPDGENATGARIWDYVSFSDAAAWKLASFLEAFGVATKKKRKGTLDTDQIVGKECKVRVRAGKNQDGEYRGEIAGTFPLPEDDEEEEDELPEDEEAEEDDDDVEESDDDDDDDDDDVDEEEDEEEEDDYNEWSLAELKEECEERGLSSKGKKGALIKRLEEDDEAEDDGDEEDDEDDDDDDEAPF